MRAKLLRTFSGACNRMETVKNELVISLDFLEKMFYNDLKNVIDVMRRAGRQVRKGMIRRVNGADI